MTRKFEKSTFLKEPNIYQRRTPCLSFKSIHTHVQLDPAYKYTDKIHLVHVRGAPTEEVEAASRHRHRHRRLRVYTCQSGERREYVVSIGRTSAMGHFTPPPPLGESRSVAYTTHARTHTYT